jgi:prepilin-type processing-associated H-X9-DG protein
LIELLVVISIIALLMAILVPSLGKARNQAKVLICSTNARQIGLIASTYQGDNDGYAPLVYNTAVPVPKVAYISLATASYWGIKLPTDFNPTRSWTNPKKGKYAEEYLPEQFICPFSVGKAAQENPWFFTGLVYGGTLPNYTRMGKEESYGTWIWKLDDFKNFTTYPTGDKSDGRPKFLVMPWHSAFQITDYSDQSYEVLKQYPVRWGSQKCRLSETTVAFCQKGQWDGWRVVRNYGSHKKRNEGGSNAVFADGHVEWVKGTKIGWQ